MSSEFEVKQRLADISLARYDQGEDVEDTAEEIEATDYFTDAELALMFARMTDGDHAEVDRILEAVEGRMPYPRDDIPSEVSVDLKAGGADRNKGGAEKLRRYWTRGPGGAKIGWKTSGDFTRCVELVGKHLGARAKGYCALRHREMVGYYPGDRRNK